MTPPSFLNSLGPFALKELLSIFNYHSHLLTTHKSGGLPLSLYYSKPGNLLVKSPLFVPSVSRHMSSNFWNVLLLTVSTILPKPTTFLVDSKPGFVKDGVVKIRLLE